MERITTITYKGKEIVVIDVSGMKLGELPAFIDVIKEAIMSHEEGSVLGLVKANNVRIDPKVISKLKEIMKFDKKYVLKSAFVGVNETQRKVINIILKILPGKKTVCFDTELEAKEWLVA